MPTIYPVFFALALAASHVQAAYLRPALSSPRSLQEWNRFYNSTTGNTIQNSDFSSNYSFFQSNVTLTDTPNTPLPMQDTCGLGSSGPFVNPAYTACGDHTSNVTATSPSSALYCNLTTSGSAVWYQTRNATNVTASAY